ncbi:hypothetical protein HFN65_34895 [Rhizobium laguerreae]|uniref:hypothetical protein n=1 Tax=Rhizobium laguerreae TaxID=1076926 RepID=UPI00144256A3|nr:hypothetical protein [Rhizobium laguerreae]MBY3502839.1 hypothetical protein [Rhizobium laguerreae]MBY3576098.1 hypothetical protein [Rhizobium laguerreae]NKN04492.1 hypothetical protein [Rhizobium laguerreae]
MIDLALIHEALGDDAIVHLQQKMTGDDSNERGRRFELTVVMFEVLMRALACLPQSNSRGNPETVVFTQGGRSFVDDIVIERPNSERYIQVKLVQKLSWGRNSLYRDFLYMRILSHHYGLKITSSLVTGYFDQVERLRSSRADYLIPEAPVRHVRHDRNLPRLSRHLHKLCNVLPDDGTLCDLIRHVETAWLDLGRTGSLAQVMWRAHTLSRGLTKSLQVSPPSVQQAVQYLNALDGLEVSADRNTISFIMTKPGIRFQGKEFSFSWGDLVIRFQANPPKTVEEFWEQCVSL